MENESARIPESIGGLRAPDFAGEIFHNEKKPDPQCGVAINLGCGVSQRVLDCHVDNAIAHRRAFIAFRR